MEDREPSFFTGLHFSDFVGIGIAFLFSLGGLYLAWRLMFGPPLYDAAIKAQERSFQTQEAPLTPQPDIHTGPGEVSVGIVPAKPPPKNALTAVCHGALSGAVREPALEPDAFPGVNSRPSLTTRPVVWRPQGRRGEKTLCPQCSAWSLNWSRPFSPPHPIWNRSLNPSSNRRASSWCACASWAAPPRPCRSWPSAPTAAWMWRVAPQLSHALLDFIEAEDPIEGDYEIEVSSPGIDRPLTRLERFRPLGGPRSQDRTHRAACHATGDRKRFRGQLLGLDGNDVVITSQNQRIQFPFRSVHRSKTRAHRQTHSGRFEGAQKRAEL